MYQKNKFHKGIFVLIMLIKYEQIPCAHRSYSPEPHQELVLHILSVPSALPSAAFQSLF